MYQRRGVTIVAILLMLVVLAAVVGALVLAGSGTLNGEFVNSRVEEARRAAEAGSQRALALLRQGSTDTWLYTIPGPAPTWEPMDHGSAEFRVLHVEGVATPTYVIDGNARLGMLPTISTIAPTLPGQALAVLPADYPGFRYHYLLSTGRSLSGHYRQVGMMLRVAEPAPPAPVPFQVVSQQMF